MNQIKPDLSAGWFFFLATFVFSWVFWGIAIVINQDFASFPTIIFYALGGFGPSIIGIFLMYFTKNKEEIKDFWYRSRDFKRIDFRGYGAIIILSSTPLLIAGWISFLFQDSGITINPNFISFFMVSVIFLIVGVLAEEFGWRGYVLDNLQRTYNDIVSSIIIGLFWGVWHIPLFFINNTYQQNLGLFSIEFWMYFIVILPQTIIFTLIYNSTNRSILSAIIFHFCLNFFGQLFSFDVLVRVISTIITFTFAILTIIFFRFRKL